VSLYQRNSQIAADFIASSMQCRKTFFGFFYRFIGENNFGQQNFIALFDFSQKSIHF